MTARIGRRLTLHELSGLDDRNRSSGIGDGDSKAGMLDLATVADTP